MVPPPLGPGELLLRGSVTEGYDLVDPHTQRTVAQGLRSLADAVLAARRHGATQIWQERVAQRGYCLPVSPRP